jgi:hypothetical protein
MDEPPVLSTTPPHQSIDEYVKGYEWLGSFSKEEHLDYLLGKKYIGPGSVIVLEFPTKRPTPSGIKISAYKVAYAVKTDKKTRRVGTSHFSLWHLYFEKLPLEQEENPFWIASPDSADGSYFKRMLKLHHGKWNLYTKKPDQ